MRQITAILLLTLAATICGPAFAATQLELSQSIRRELAADNWSIFLQYHWIQPLIDGAETAEERLSAEDTLRTLEREIQNQTKDIRVSSISHPKIACSYDGTEFDLTIESFDIAMVTSRGPRSLPTELVYVRHKDRWFVFHNDETLRSNFALADLIQWVPESPRSKTPKCLRRLKLGQGANNSFKPKPLRGSA